MNFHVQKLLLADIEIFGSSTNVVNFLRKAMQSQELLGHVVQEVMIVHLILRNSFPKSNSVMIYSISFKKIGN